MTAAATELKQQISAYAALSAEADKQFEAILDLARKVAFEDREAAPLLLDAASIVGRSAQVREGQLIQVLAQADRLKAHRAGLSTWIATHLDVTDGKARGIAEAAKRIGAEPTLAEALSSGDIGADTIRVLARTAKAVAGTSLDRAETLATVLDLAAREGTSAARHHVRVVEETIDPGRAERLLARQRRRSFARIIEVESGMVRLEALFDPVRATVLRAAIDSYTAEILRSRQYDGRTDAAPADVCSTEQIQAHALVRCAEVFLTADSKTRGARFTVPVMYHTPLIRDKGEFAESVYGDAIPAATLPPPGAPGTHLLEHDDGQPVRLDGRPLDADPEARLASADQRIALAFRDRHCSHPGCARPPTWALHAHHRTPYSQGGPTVMDNLTLYCSEHHTLAHQSDQPDPDKSGQPENPDRQ